MKTIKQILILAITLLVVACSKKEIIPDVPGVMSATVEMVAGDFDRTQYYKYIVKINRDQNVIGENTLIIESENSVGRGLHHINGELYLNPVNSDDNEFAIEYQPLTEADKLSPFAFDITITAGNTQPVKLRISLDKPLILENRMMYLGLDQTKHITAASGLQGATFTSTDNSIVTVDAKGRIKGIQPGKTTIGVKRNGVVATCAILVVNYRPVNDFTLNINGKDYHAATDTLFVKQDEILNVRMGRLLPEDGNWMVKCFEAFKVTTDKIGDLYGGTIKSLKDFILWKDFYTNQTYTFSANEYHINETSCFLFIIKIFPELPDPYYNFTFEQNQIRYACEGLGFDGNSYPIRLQVRLAE